MVERTNRHYPGSEGLFLTVCRDPWPSVGHTVKFSFGENEINATVHTSRSVAPDLVGRAAACLSSGGQIGRNYSSGLGAWPGLRALSNTRPPQGSLLGAQKSAGSRKREHEPVTALLQRVTDEHGRNGEQPEKRKPIQM
jgi:hypothetical protein